jgi:predicted transcriptional regulator
MTTSRNRGELEADIMNVLWNASEPVTARDVQDAFTVKVPAITTIITVLDRMRTKGSVVREATGGRSYVFSAARSRVLEITETMSSALHGADDRTAALLLFAGSLSEEDRQFLRSAIKPVTDDLSE